MVKKDILIKVGLSLGSASVASVVTWVIANRKLSDQYDERLAHELKASIDYIMKKLDIPVIISDEDPDNVVDELNDIEQPIDIVISELEEVDGERVFSSEENKPPLEDLVSRNQKTRYDKISTPDVDEVNSPAVEEISNQIESDPDIFVISRDAFMANESEFEQETLTYFADGGVLNENMDFVENHESMIGVGRPAFGSESDDDNVVYVRNTKTKREFEILSDPGASSDFLIHSLGDIYKPEWARGK